MIVRWSRESRSSSANIEDRYRLLLLLFHSTIVKRDAPRERQGMGNHDHAFRVVHRGPNTGRVCTLEPLFPAIVNKPCLLEERHEVASSPQAPSGDSVVEFITE